MDPLIVVFFFQQQICFSFINNSCNFARPLFKVNQLTKTHVVASVGSPSVEHEPGPTGEMLGAGRRVVVGL